MGFGRTTVKKQQKATAVVLYLWSDKIRFALLLSICWFPSEHVGIQDISHFSHRCLHLNKCISTTETIDELQRENKMMGRTLKFDLPFSGIMCSAPGWWKFRPMRPVQESKKRKDFTKWGKTRKSVIKDAIFPFYSNGKTPTMKKCSTWKE